MNLRQQILTNNECYIVNKNKTHTPKGGILHSTGANNPYLCRYIAPDDGFLGKPSTQHWNQKLTGGKKACVHAFIGKLNDNKIATYQILPWNMPCWGSGSGSLGNARNANNTGYLQVEICEDGLNDKDYFNLVYIEAVELFAFWSKVFNWNPLKDILCHSEAHKKGIASNHADVMHWFSKHGKNMNMFRQDVQKELSKLKNANTGDDKDMIRYNELNEIPKDFRFTIEKMIKKGFLKGSGEGPILKLNLSEDMIRTYVIMDRAGVWEN